MQDASNIVPSSGLLTIPQVATYLGVCRAHVYKLIHQGLPVVRLGRRVFIRLAALTQWIEEQERDDRTS